MQLDKRFSLLINNNNLRDNIFRIIKFFESNIYKLDPSVSNDIKNQFLHVLNNFLSSPLTYNDIEEDICYKIRCAKRFLLDHPNITFTRTNKGNVIIAKGRDIYIDMQDLLSDKNIYIKIDKDSIKKITNDLRLLLTRWREKEYISIENYRSLFLSDGIISRLYGLPKIHKKDCSLRIIVSSINSPLHSFASFLHNILYQYLPKPKSHIQNSFELVNKLRYLHR